MATNQSGRKSKGVCEKVYSAITASRVSRKIHRKAHGQQNSSSAQLPTYDRSGSGKEVFIETGDSGLPNEMTTKFHAPKIGPPGEGEGQVPKFGSTRVVELEKPKPETKIGLSQETKATSEPTSTPSRKQIETPPSPLVQGEKNSLETVQEGRAQLQTKQPKKQSSSIHDKGEGHHDKVGDDKFSKYINKVTNKLRAPSNVGDAKIGVTRRDSFNDKVSKYINSAKFKIRTTTTVGAAGSTSSSK